MDVKERPVIFSGNMIRAILEGRKRQTRRVMKPQPPEYEPSPSKWPDKHPGPYIDEYADSGVWCWWSPDDRMGPEVGRCPYGRPGDRLWCKETHFFAGYPHWSDLPHKRKPVQVDGEWQLSTQCCYYREGFDRSHSTRWRPSIYMPRWASRLTLEVKRVWPQRVQDITEEDAIAEGYDCSGMQPACDDAARMWFRTLWDSLHAKHPERMWQANPYVWAIEFRRIER